MRYLSCATPTTCVRGVFRIKPLAEDSKNISTGVSYSVRKVPKCCMLGVFSCMVYGNDDHGRLSIGATASWASWSDSTCRGRGAVL